MPKERSQLQIPVTGQQLLSARITMFVMAAEHFDKYKVASSQEQRTCFYREKGTEQLEDGLGS
jgi:hypothetical protein